MKTTLFLILFTIIFVSFIGCVQEESKILGKIEIQSIELERQFYNETNTNDLFKGPILIGEPSFENLTLIIGAEAQFKDIKELKGNEKIIITTPDIKKEYRVIVTNVDIEHDGENLQIYNKLTELSGVLCVVSYEKQNELYGILALTEETIKVGIVSGFLKEEINPIYGFPQVMIEIPKIDLRMNEYDEYVEGNEEYEIGLTYVSGKRSMMGGWRFTRLDELEVGDIFIRELHLDYDVIKMNYTVVKTQTFNNDDELFDYIKEGTRVRMFLVKLYVEGGGFVAVLEIF